MSSFVIRSLITAFAILAMIAHLTKWHEIQFTWESLVLLAIAILPWLSAFIQSFKFGKDSLEIQLRELEKKADAAIDAGLRGTGKSPETALATSAAKRKTATGDPQKGKWGGSPNNSGRSLTARVEKIPNESYFRRLVLRVESVDLARPLAGEVFFHLHPTFSTPDYSEPVINGVAETSVISYGAFTIGAEADNRETKLELDLAMLDDGKDQFYKR